MEYIYIYIYTILEGGLTIKYQNHTIVNSKEKRHWKLVFKISTSILKRKAKILI